MKVSGRLVSLKVDATDHSDDVSKAVVTSGAAEDGFLSFAKARSGGDREYKLAMTIAQDTAAGSLWSEVYDNPGDTVPYVIAPHGNTTASPSQPHFGGNAIISEPDGDLIGGEASTNANGALTVEVEWVCTGRPAKITS